MDQQIKEFSTIVRGVQTTNKEILVQLKSIKELDKQVCSCTCHSSNSSLAVSEELEEHKTRIKALENLVQELLTKDRHNATDEYKSRTGVRDDRTHNADQDSSGKANIRQGTPPNVRLAIDKPGALRVNDAQTESKTSSARPTKQPEGTATNIPETKHSDKSSSQEGRGDRLAHIKPQTKRDGNIARPNFPQRPITRPVRNLTPDSEHLDTPDTTSENDAAKEENRVAVRPKVGDNGTTAPSGGGATASTSAEEDNFDVEVIHQEEARVYAKVTDWSVLAQMELDSGQATSIRGLEGAHTCICLDISESMAQGDAWRQAKTFLLEYFDGLSKMAREHRVTDEYVSFVTFGHDTRVVKRLTNKYEELRHTVDCVKLGGPSPMYGGLYFALVSLIQSEKWSTSVNDFTVDSKIILISDGNVTDTRQQAGPDVMDSKEEFTTDLFTPLTEILRRGIDMYVVPVGNANTHTMEMMAAEKGRILPCGDGEKLAKRYFLTKALGPGIRRSLFGPTFQPNFKSEHKLGDSDRLHMLEIFEELNKKRFEEIAREREVEDVYYDSNRETLLPVGSRVRRGPDWNHDDNDNNGPGTVVGHNRFVEKLFVQWDTGKIYQYNYGVGNAYDVLPADDVRLPKPGHSISVGCVVKPTEETKNKHPDIQAFDRGVAVRFTDDHKVWVKWNSGKSGKHLYLPGVIQEVEFCEPMESPAPVVKNTVPEKKQGRHKNKNK